MNKKAETIIQKYMIEEIIVIISFVLLLGIWAIFSWQGDIDRSSCRLSVLARASATIGSVAEFKEIIPLKCETEKICLRSSVIKRTINKILGKDEGCDLAGEKIYTGAGGGKENVLDYIADTLYSWHVTLGEGKINFMQVEWTQKKYCILNSIIALDRATKEQVEREGGITYREIFDTLAAKKTDKGTSYLKEIYRVSDTSAFSGLPLDNQLDLSKDIIVVDILPQKGKLTAVLFQTAEFAYPQMVIPLKVEQLIVRRLINPEDDVTVTQVLFGTSSTYFMFAPDPNIPNYAPPQVISYDLELLKNLKCTSFESLA